MSGDEGVVKVEEKEGDSETIIKSTLYNLEFTFDTDVRVAITIYYFATEEISNGQATWVLIAICFLDPVLNDN